MKELGQSKADMTAFLNHLTDARRSAEAIDRHKRSRQYIWGSIRDKKKEGVHNVAEKVLTTIYANSLPLDAEHKAIYESSINSTIMDHIRKSGSVDTYDYLEKAAKRGSLPAKTICESAERVMTEICNKYYTEEDLDPDDIDMTPESENVMSAVTKITSDMNADEVSTAIENNVKATIAKEMEISKQEDEKLAELEKQLSDDDSVQEESAIDTALHLAGFGAKNIYKPQLFTSIMMGKVKTFTEDGDLEGDAIQKKAFYESVKELAALQTLNTLGCIDINIYNVDKVAAKYLAG